MKIVSIAVSKKKGTRKSPVKMGELVPGHGLAGDGHAGEWHRQVSFLAQESIAQAQAQGLDVTFGDFAENFATTGIDWKSLPIGTRVRVGESALVEVTQIGKVCHKPCAIFYQAGDCIFPREGVFARVLESGTVRVGDRLRFETAPKEASPG